MNKIVKFFHELRNPHCEHCIAEYEDSKYNGEIATLKMENARLIRDNERLLNIILEKPVEKVIEPADPRELKPIITPGSSRLWSVQRRMLEEKDRKDAQLLKQRAKEINEPVIDDKTKSIEELIVNAE